MAEGEGTGFRRDEGGRPVVYCLIPPDLAPRLHELLRAHFRDDPGVEAVVERRGRERRAGGDRRRAEAGAPAAEERRLIRATGGRRVGERRAALVAASSPALPRRARRHADELGFVRRMEPSTQEAEDRDTARVVAGIQAGDRDGCAVLYTRYFDRVYGYLRIALRDHHEAEDGTQQVFVKLLESIDRYERRGQPFRAWLFAIVRNHAISQLKKLGRLDVMEPEELNRRRRDIADEQVPSILEWISDRDLVLFYERLPLPQRQVLLLRFALDLSNDQVAAILGRSLNEVRVLQHRGLRVLRERLAAIGRGPKTGRQRPAMARCPPKARVLRERRFALFG